MTPDRSGQESGGKESGADVLDRAYKRCEGFEEKLPPGAWRIAERYARIELWIHINLAALGPSYPVHYCPVLQGVVPVDLDLRAEDGNTRCWAFLATRDGDRSINRKQYSVLFCVVEFLKKQQVVVPSFVPLDLLKKVHRRFFPARLGFRNPSCESGNTAADGELFAPRIRAQARGVDLPPKEIEGGTQVVNDIPGNRAKAQRGQLPLGDKTENAIPAAFVLTNNLGVGFEKGDDLGYEITDEFIGPIYFDPAAGSPRAVAHG